MHVIHEQIVRKRLPNGDAQRIFHGRGLCFPGYEDLVIDYYPPVVMVILYQKREDTWLKRLSDMLLNELPGCQAIYVQERYRSGAPGYLHKGTLPEQLNAHEADLIYRLRLGDAQNVGFFPDMAMGRKVIRQRAVGKKVLNLFSYTCSFSVAALAGGASQVVNLDMNRGALELGRINHQINDIDLRKVSFLPLELFRSIGKLRKLGPFDLIICDPPATQGKSFTAEKHWAKLVRKLPGLLAEEGEVFACLNAPNLPAAFLDQLFAEEIGFSLVENFSPGEDFPEATTIGGLYMGLYRRGKSL